MKIWLVILGSKLLPLILITYYEHNFEMPLVRAEGLNPIAAQQSVGVTIRLSLLEFIIIYSYIIETSTCCDQHFRRLKSICMQLHRLCMWRYQCTVYCPANLADYKKIVYYAYNVCISVYIISFISRGHEKSFNVFAIP